MGSVHTMGLVNSTNAAVYFHLWDMLNLLMYDAFIRTNCHAVAMMFVYQSVHLGQACIVIIRFTLVWI